MLQREVNWFLYCTAYTGVFLYPVFNTVELHSLTATLSGTCFSEMLFSEPRRFGEETKKKERAVAVNTSTCIS